MDVECCEIKTEPDDKPSTGTGKFTVFDSVFSALTNRHAMLFQFCKYIPLCAILILFLILFIEMHAVVAVYFMALKLSFIQLRKQISRLILTALKTVVLIQ